MNEPKFSLVTLTPKIAAKLKRYQEAQRALIDTALAQQQACKHKLCWELPFRSYQYGGCSRARRICVHCRYEEEGSHWSGGSVWNRHGYRASVLAKSLVIAQLSLDEFRAKRLPVNVPDFHPSAIAERARAATEDPEDTQ